MRKQIMTTVAAVLFVVGIGLANEAHAAGACNLQTIKGNYAGLVIGTIPGIPLGVAGSPTVTFDGAGNFTGKDAGLFGGFPNNSTMTGSYTVEADCSGTLTTVFDNGFTVPSRITISDNGTEISMLITFPGEAGTGTFKRVGGPCNLQTIKGSYAGFVKGEIPGVPLGVQGAPVTTFDGAGNFTDSDGVVFGGNFFPGLSSAGTYTVNSDCTGTLDHGGSIMRLLIVDNGKEIFGLVTDFGPLPPQVTTADWKRQ